MGAVRRVSKPTMKDLIKKAGAKLASTAEKGVKSTKESRIAQWKSPLEELGADKLVELDTTMREFVPTHFGSVVLTEPRELTEHELFLIATEIKAARFINEATAGADKRIRELFRTHLDATGEDNGTVAFSDLGYRFRWSGKGTGEPVPDYTKLKDILTPEQYEDVVSTTYTVTGLIGEVLESILSDVVASQVQEVSQVDEDKLAAMLVLDDDLYAKFEDILFPGAEKGGSFYFEPIPNKDK